jgi:hypothetical protein
MKHGLLCSVIAAGVLANQTFAGTAGPVLPYKDLTWVGLVAVGPVWTKSGKTLAFYVAPEQENAYVAKKLSNTIGLTKNSASRVLLQTRCTHPCRSRKPSMAFEGLQKYPGR